MPGTDLAPRFVEQCGVVVVAEEAVSDELCPRRRDAPVLQDNTGELEPVEPARSLSKQRDELCLLLDARLRHAASVVDASTAGS